MNSSPVMVVTEKFTASGSWLN